MPPRLPGRAALATLGLFACTRPSTSSDAAPALPALEDAAAERTEAPEDACPGEVHGEPVQGLEAEGLRFRVTVEGQPMFPICATCDVSMFFDPPGTEQPVFVLQSEMTGTISGLMANEPADGACVRVSGRLDDLRGRPVGRYRRRSARP